MNRYQHSQFGKMIVGLMGILIFAADAAAIFLFFEESKEDFAFLVSLLGSIIVVYVMLIVCFYNLTVIVDETQLRIRFGIGLIRKSWFLGDIQRVEMVKNKWWYGWGIHLTPHGWLYNIDGFDGIEVEFTDGRKMRIGTDEPQKLKEAIGK